MTVPRCRRPMRVLERADACRAAQLIGEGAGASGYRQRHGGKRGRDALAARGSYVEVRLREAQPPCAACWKPWGIR